MSLAECYGTITGNYGDGGPHYDKNQGHRGTDYRRQPGQPIYAYDDMVLESIDSGSGLGVSIGLRRRVLGGFAGYAHVTGIRGRVGAVFNRGDIIAYPAGWDDYHGSMWTGPHIHTTQGFVSAYNCSVGIRPLSDPAPVIAAAINGGSTAGGGGTTPLDGEEMNAEEWRQFQVMAGNVNKISERVANIDAWISEGGPGVDKGLAKPGTVAARTINLDRQVTGANGWKVNLVQHVLDIKRKLGI